VCTLTVIPEPWLSPARAESVTDGPASADRCRVVFSRDEKRSRSRAHPPVECVVGGRVVTMPIDSEAGGSWIAATDAGVVCCVLNLTLHESSGNTPERPVVAGTVSRGTLIPWLVESADAAAAWGRLCALDPSSFAPFLLLSITATERAEARWDGTCFEIAREAFDTPWMRTTSSLGDARVARPRAALFDQWFATRPIAPEVQDAFHRHVWEHQPELSVRMSRPDACTVSITTVRLGSNGVSMSYEPLECDGRVAVTCRVRGRTSSAIRRSCLEPKAIAGTDLIG